MYLWWSLCTLYLLACQVRVTVGGSAGLCCCVCVACVRACVFIKWSFSLYELKNNYTLALYDSLSLVSTAYIHVAYNRDVKGLAYVAEVSDGEVRRFFAFF